MSLNVFTIQEPDGDQRNVPINIVSGVSYPPVQIVFGDPTADEAIFVDADNPLPVVGTFSFSTPPHIIIDSGTITIDSASLIGIKGTDGALIATADNPVPVSGVLIGTASDGSRHNVSVTPLNELRVRDEAIIGTHSGSGFFEGIRDDIHIDFSTGTHIGEISGIYDDGSVGGTATLNTTHGRLDVSVPATASKTAIFRSLDRTIYEPGHTIRCEMSIAVSAQPTGNGYVEWGVGDSSNVIGWRYDSSGMHAIRRKNSVLEYDAPQASWNRDTCTAQTGSLFRVGGSPQSLNPLKNNIYTNEFEWLGADPPEWQIKSPSKEFVSVNVEEFANNNTGTTVPSPRLGLFIKIANDTTSGQAITVSMGSWRGGVHTSKLQAVILSDTRGVVTDASGNNRNGLLIGTASPNLVSPSPFTGGGNGAFEFIGSPDLGIDATGVQVPPAGFGVSTGSSSFQITTNIKRYRSGAGVTEAIAGKWGAAAANENWLFQISGDKLAISMQNGSNTIVSAVGTTTLAINTLYAVKGIWDGANLKVYVNNVQEGTTPAFTTLRTPDTSTPLTIGRITGATSYPFHGVIDEVSITLGSIVAGLYHMDNLGYPSNIGQRSMAQSLSVTMASDQTAIPVSNTTLANLTGTWGYNAGVSGTVALSGGKKVLQITAIAEEAAASLTINAGDTITLPYGSTDKVSSAITIEPKGNLTNPTIIFTSTKSYFIEWVV